MRLDDGDDSADVLVIGAGPAGTLSAILAARAGARTTLVERKRFPRDKTCGGCLNAAGVGLLQSLGLGDVADGIPLDEILIGFRGRRVRLCLPRGVAVSRKRFDARLVDRAKREGVRLLSETSASLGSVVGRHRRVELSDTHGTRSIAARVVVVACGLTGSAIRRHGQFVTRIARHSKIGASCFVPTWPDCYGGRTITMAVGRDGYVGLGCTVDGLDIAFAASPDSVRRAGSPAAAAADILREAGFPSVPGLDRAGWSGTVPITRTTRPVAAERTFLVGDAAGYVEPFTGQGMAIALQGAVALSRHVVRSLDGWSPAIAADWKRQYRREIAARAWPAELVARIVRIPWLASITLGLADAFPSAPDVLVRAINRTTVHHPVFWS